VDHNPLVMSVEPLSGRSGPFVVSVDREFIEELSDQELEAALLPVYEKVWQRTDIRGNLAEFIAGAPCQTPPQSSPSSSPCS